MDDNKLSSSSLTGILNRFNICGIFVICYAFIVHLLSDMHLTFVIYSILRMCLGHLMHLTFVIYLLYKMHHVYVCYFITKLSLCYEMAKTYVDHQQMTMVPIFVLLGRKNTFNICDTSLIIDIFLISNISIIKDVSTCEHFIIKNFLIQILYI